MPTIMADHDVEGHVRVLLTIWLSPGWIDLWTDAHCNVVSFRDLGLDEKSTDAEIWQLCQEQAIILVTGNRNAEGEDSLEQTMRRHANPDCLPVLTIGDTDRLMRDRRYAESVAARLLDYVRDIDVLRGSARLYLP
jgi:predicted nuclease of predicted toxin-antitoxin system